MSKVLMTMTQEQVLDAIQDWLLLKSGLAAGAYHFNLKATAKGFSVVVTSKEQEPKS